MRFLFFLFSALFAEIIGTIVGFGSSTILLPLSLFFFDFRTALVLVALFHIFGNLGRIGFFKSGLDKGIIFKFGIPSVALTLVGASLVSFTPQELLKGILGIFLVLYSLMVFWKEDFAVRPTLTNSVLGGGLSGFLAGLIGTGGALRGTFLTGFGLPKEKYIATSAAIALAVDVTRIPIYFSQGFLNRAYYFSIPILLVIALVGAFTGIKFVYGWLKLW
ncbi:MAG: sulfite exporter TauE/SafE family protein [Patescibacteria group bacterium]